MKNFIFFTETPAKLHSSGRWLHHRSSQTPPKHTNDHSILHEISQGIQIRAWFVQKKLETGKTNATKFEHKNGNLTNQRKNKQAINPESFNTLRLESMSYFLPALNLALSSLFSNFLWPL
jgi:hypothetical protein